MERRRRRRWLGCGTGCLATLVLLAGAGAYVAWRAQGAWEQGASLAARAVPEGGLAVVRMLNATDVAGMRIVAGPSLRASDSDLARVLSEVRRRSGFVFLVVPRGASGSARDLFDPKAEISARLEVRGRTGVARYVRARLRSEGGGWRVTDLRWEPEPAPSKP